MDLERLTREVRAAERVHTFHQLFRREEIPTQPALVHGGGAVAVAAFYNKLAERLPYGSAVVMNDLGEKYVAAVENLASTLDWRPWTPSGIGEGEHAWVRSIHDTSYPAQKQHVLAAAKATKGPILCFGSDEEITPELHELCKAEDRLLVTVDTDEAVLVRFGHLITDFHFIDVESDSSASKWLDRDDWGVIFVDQGDGETRKRTIARSRTCTEFLVVHDSDNLDFALDEVLGTFPHRNDFKNSRPWTTIVSQRSEVWAELSAEAEKQLLQEQPPPPVLAVVPNNKKRRSS